MGSQSALWFAQTTTALMERAQKGKGKAQHANKGAQKEARQRASDLSTSSSTVGVSFSGAVFQADYFKRLFQKRGELAWSVLRDLEPALPWATDAAHVRVASFGGGPGTDSAGLVWLARWHYPHTVFHVDLFDYETTWKKYTHTLQEQFGPRVQLSFSPCNVTLALEEDENRRVDVTDTDLLMFFYVCHETSSLAIASDLVFYTDVARCAKAGSVLLFADVQEKSRAHLLAILRAMAAVRMVVQLPLPRSYAAEVLAFQFT